MTEAVEASYDRVNGIPELDVNALDSDDALPKSRSKSLKVIQLPFENTTNEVVPKWETTTWMLPCPMDPGQRKPSNMLLDAFLIYLGRLTNQRELHIGWGVHDMKEEPKTQNHNLVLPMIIEVDFDEPWKCVSETVDIELEFLKNYKRRGNERLLEEKASTEKEVWQIGVSSVLDKNRSCPGSISSLGELITLQINSKGYFRWFYDANRLSVEAVHRMSEHLRIILRVTLHSNYSDVPISELNLLSDRDKNLLKTWNATERSFPDKLCVHQLFEKQSVKFPDAIALVCEEQRLTYAELNVKANNLARELVRLGVGPDHLVPICVGRSTGMIVGLLAVLKAGGAYVPLDPTYPCKRLTQVLKEAASTVVLVDSTGRAALGEHSLSSLTIIDPNSTTSESECNDEQVVGLTSRNLAYVTYTSGSTGTPKGVMIEHRGLVNAILAYIESFEVNETSRVLQAASISFDLSVADIMMSLCSGATLYVPIRSVHLDPRDLWSHVEEHSITHVSMTPSVFGDGKKLPEISTIPTLILSAESPSKQLLSNLKRRAKVFNAFGATENTIYASIWSCPLENDSERGVTIGRPIPNTRLYILDPRGNPIPVGAIGELYVGGVGIARGYFNRPEETRKRFLRDPFAGDGDSRMYRSGDLARYLDDGSVVFLGRADDQIKIRGFRIEPSEIESCLTNHDAVKEAVVLVRGEGSDRRLIAYVVSEALDDLPRTLREHLAENLPEYMVPSVFVKLDGFPFMPNGKLDRKALPAPDENSFVRQTYERPRNHLEITLANSWRELFGIDRIGRNDSFFALGGHSLLAVRMIDILNSHGMTLKVGEVFQHPVLFELAKNLENSRSASSPSNLIDSTTRILTPDMLPLIELTQAEIDVIVEQVPGGIDNIQDIYSLSPLQDGILFHHLLASNGDPYLLRGKKSYEDRKSLNRYLEAVQAVVNRHDIFRTAFVTKGLSIPAQVVWRRASISVEVTTKNDVFDPAQYHMDLNRAPLLHFIIQKEESGDWILVHLMHHLIGDHMTLENMLKEVEMHMSGRLNDLPSPVPFRNVVSQIRSSADHEAHTSFFTEMLADVDEPTLPFGLAEVHLDGSQLTHTRWSLNPEIDDRLRLRARRVGASVAVLCHVAFAQVISRTSGRTKVVFGTVLSGRTQIGAHSEGAMGLFMNTLPVRVDIGDNSVLSCLEDAKKRLALLLEHEQASVILAQSCSSVPNGTPVFSALFNYRHATMERNPSSEVMDVEAFETDERTNYPLTFSIDDYSFGLEFTASVREPFDPKRLCSYMEEALKSLVDALESSPTSPIGSLEVLPADEREMLLETWNVTEETFTEPGVCMHHLFERQVRIRPKAVAVHSVHEGLTLTYEELNARANRLGRELIELGVRPDQLVAICVERSAAMIVGILAILKAGGAYVPLDPSYPSERLIEVLKDAEPKIVVADKTGSAVLGEPGIGARIVVDPNVPRERSEENQQVVGLGPRHLAYVIYTSGSTGRPKGVMVEHRNLVRLFDSTESWFDFCERDVWCAFNSISFDVSIWELWGSLRYGGQLSILSHDIARSPKDLQSHIGLHGITILNQTPSALRAFTEVYVENPLPDRLRLVICGGEALDASLLGSWYSARGNGLPRLGNMYGTTETTVQAIYKELDPIYANSKLIPIGKKIPDLKIYILDANGRPVPVGVEGELYIGGAGVARGYLNRPDLTAERFLKNPFDDSTTARFYKTGDVVRYLPNGDLECIGRKDSQIKIRGFRVEPSEIETCLSSHPIVREALVVSFGEGNSKRLIAYVVSTSEDDLARLLHDHVSAKLPNYMVPSAFVGMKQFPLTPSGKLDRNALPAPGQNALPRRTYEAPQGSLEAALAKIWMELLDVDSVSRKDTFSALGGHSLLAVRMMSRVAALGVEVPLSVIFASNSLMDLAKAISDRVKSEVKIQRPRIARLNVESSDLPVSFSQRRLWFLAQLEGTKPVYNIPFALRLRGSLDVRAWQRSLDALWSRHKILRARFVSVDGEPMLRLRDPDSGIPLLQDDLRAQTNPEAELKRLSEQESHVSFDLENEPLIRARLIQLTENEWVFMLTQHHIVSDGSSIDVLLRELNALYPAFLEGRPDPLPPMRIQYPDYAKWQEDWLTQDRVLTLSQFWKENLAGAPELLELPTDRPRSLQWSHDGDFVPVILDENLTASLIKLSHKYNGTLFTTILAAWASVLSRLSGQDDLIVGAPSANRTLSELEDMVGFFVNMLPLRMDLSGHPSATELLAQAQKTVTEAQDHQDLPFEQMVELLRPVRRLSHAPIFQVIFAWQINATNLLSLPGLKVVVQETVYDSVKFDLELNLCQEGNQVVGNLGFSEALFDRKTMERQVGYLLQTLQSMVTDPKVPLEEIDVISSAERSLLLETWNTTGESYPDHICVHQLFEQQVSRRPQATALVCEEEVFSYAELNSRANALAHRLLRFAVTPDDLVVICVGRSSTMVIALLAVLKAGGAYVPLDPNHGSQRLVKILNDACPKIVLADATGATTLGENNLGNFILLDPEMIHDHCPDSNPLVSGLTSRHLAYVVYTSGSTGVPKGVMIEHRSIVNLALAQVSRFRVLNTSKVLQFVSISFDVSAGDIAMAWGCGAAIHIAVDAIRHDPSDLWRYVRKHKVTHVCLTPALLRDKSSLSDFEIQTTVILSGETLSPTLVNNLRNRVRLINAYGPTECTVNVTSWCSENEHNQKEFVPIGRPYPNTRLYVLDSLRRPVPLGSVGELYIGGDCVARGYLNLPKLTEEYFLLDPFQDRRNSRMYKTGDLVRYLPNGNLVFIGRNDHQVKIRGFRIEPSEIEASLLAHPEIREALVTVFIAEDDKRLVAYFVSNQIDDLIDDLRMHLLARLPDYMVPSAFVRLEQFPLTPNGKVDRRALPTPSEDAFLRRKYEPPRNAVEEALATIWSEILGLKRIGRYDSFFELGGHSLIAVRMVERLRNKGLTLSIRDLFQCPVLHELAETLKQHRDVEVPPNLIPPQATTITPDMLPLIDITRNEIKVIVEQVPNGAGNIQDIYALAPLQEGILFHHLLLEDGDPYVLTIRKTFGDRCSLDYYLEAMRKVIDRHDIMRTAFIWEGLSVPAQVVWRRASLPIDELGPTSDEENSETIFEVERCRLDVRRAPLLRVGISVSERTEKWTLVVHVHHLIGDHVTLDIMSTEIETILSSGEDRLPAPEPFRNLVARTRLSRDQNADRVFFKKMLSNVCESTLPFGLNRVYRDGSKLGDSYAILSPELNEALRHQAKISGVSLAALCHLAFARVISGTSGRSQVVFGTVLSGRVKLGVSETAAMGLYINTLPFCVCLENTSARDSLREVHNLLAELLEYEHASLALAQQCSGVPKGSPLFSALLNYRHNSVADNWSLEKVMAQALEGGERTNYPLMLSIEDFGSALGITVQVSEPVDAGRLCGYMQRSLESLVRALASESMRSIGSLEIVPEVERTMLVETWNATKVPLPRNSCIHQLFEERVREHPDAVALVCENRRVTYRELNRLANGVASQLIALGVRAEHLVAICMDRSIGMIVGLMGILKAGGAYVPLDPAYPGQRLIRVLNDANPRVVVADSLGFGILGKEALASRVVIDPNSVSGKLDVAPRVLGSSSSNLAYVIYTSGSTGLPNGVMVEQGSIVNLALAQIEKFEIDANSNVLQFVSLSFDISVGEITMTLLRGATLHITVGAVRQNPKKLWNYVQEQGITHVSVTPSFLRDFDVPLLKNPPIVMLVGEASSMPLVRRLQKSARVFNAYGPTECTVSATIWRARSDYFDNLVPIGRPIWNTRLYILDPDRRLLPLGVVGELYIGGIGVARGYLNREELTRSRFLADPFVDSPEARMYKTGDLAYYSPDGNVVYISRVDQQMKIRGFRVEPGEIEACLKAHPAVVEAVVTTFDYENDERLIAYVKTAEIDDLALILRKHCSSRLPNYMVPSGFMRLDHLPMTPNGKLDRNALPKPNFEAVARKAYEPPVDSLERALAKTWSELLDVDKVSRHDSFFALGGHSLLAVRLMSRIALLGVELPLSTIFQSTSLESLAETIRSKSKTKTKTQQLSTIDRIPRDEDLPLSFAQQRLWFLSQLDGPNTVHNILFALRLRGSLDVHTFKRALDIVYSRHESLRSIFVSVEGEPRVRLLDPDTGIPLQQRDLRMLVGDSEVEKALNRLCSMEAKETFQLDSGPLIRGVLIRLTNDEYVFLLTQHHIVSDGWSIGVLVREVSTLYESFLRGEPDPLSPLQIQYPDYANWQREHLSADRLNVHSSYWHRMLSTAPVSLDLPTDRPRPSPRSHTGSSVPIVLDVNLTRALRSLSKNHDVTLFMTILAAWSTVLSRLSNQRDVVIGVPCANRTRKELEGLIGFFVNMLALRIDLSNSPTVAGLLARVREIAITAQEHQELPFENVVEIVQPVRKLSHTPIFQVIFAWQNNQESQLSLPKLQVSTESPIHETVQFDLELNLSEINDEIVGGLGFATSIFDLDTVERHVEYLKSTLRAMVANTQQVVERISLLGDSERSLLLETWNTTEKVFPDYLCVQKLFERNVVRSPRAVAVVHGRESLTYEDVDSRASALALELVRLGVTREDPVVLCTTRSPAMVVGLLAILKAGGVYVPLDPTHPSHRLSRILRAAAPKVVVADQSGLVGLGRESLEGSTVLDPNGCCEEPKSHFRLPERSSRDLAYMVYTSGSTGLPKGVMVEHRSLVNAVLSHVSELDVNETSRVLQYASISFDVSIAETMMALVSGARLFICDNTIRQDPEKLWSYVNDNDITHVMLTPSFLQGARTLPKTTRMPRLVLGGEAASPELIKKLSNHADITIAYGPTECTVASTFWSCGPVLGQIVPIGRPIWNTRLYVLDKTGGPVPIGVTGELYVGGAGVARGYHNEPKLTAEYFLKNNFSDDPESRLYKTGDMAYYLPDGNLVFVARNDEQIKVRGFRIEPAEIEVCLTNHFAVTRALVTTFTDKDDTRLVAYVLATDIDALPRTLREHLATQLPEYMVPSAFVRLDSLPLTPNGKLDYKSLPVPDESAFVRPAYELPKGNVETVLANIWSQLLGLQRVSRHDNFFDLGGHSLLALRLQHLTAARGLSCTLNDLFETPVLIDLASKIKRTQNSKSCARPVAIPVRTGGTGPPLFFLPAGNGDFSYAFALAREISTECPVYALPGPSPWEQRVSSLDELAERTIALIEDVQPNSPYRICGYSSGAVLAHAVARLLETKGESVTFLGLIDGATPSYHRSIGMKRRDLIVTELLESSENQHLPEIASIYQQMDDLSDTQVVEIAQRLNIYPPNMDTHLLVRQIEAKLNYAKIINDYAPRELSVIIHQFYAIEPPPAIPVVSDIDLSFWIKDRSLGWRQTMSDDSPIQLVPIPGNHLTIVNDPDKRMVLGCAIADALTNPRS